MSDNAPIYRVHRRQNRLRKGRNNYPYAGHDFPGSGIYDFYIFATLDGLENKPGASLHPARLDPHGLSVGIQMTGGERTVIGTLVSSVGIDDLCCISGHAFGLFHGLRHVMAVRLGHACLSKQLIIPFFTYGATTYLNESMQKIYKCTPNSVHIPETLPEDLDADDITHPGRPDDAGIDMPGSARGVEGWLTRLGLLGNSGVSDLESDSDNNISISRNGSEVNIVLDELMNPNTVHIYNLNGTLVYRMSNKISYSFPAPEKALYLLSMVYGADNKRFNKKIAL